MISLYKFGFFLKHNGASIIPSCIDAWVLQYQLGYSIKNFFRDHFHNLFPYPLVHEAILQHFPPASLIIVSHVGSEFLEVVIVLELGNKGVLAEHAFKGD